ncbi:MAG: hypothetical protein AB4042_20210, partial [Leptolyngbyaceae cyanobacterium]
MKLSFFATVAAMLPLSIPLLFYASGQFQRPPRQEIAYPLFQGIDYQRRIRETPRPQVIHQVRIDLSAEGVQPFVTPPPNYRRDLALIHI